MRKSKKSKSLELGPSSLKTSSSSLSCHEATGQRSSSARVTLILAKTAFSLPYVKFSFQATTFSSDIEM